jgi:hypothetical protein
MNDWKQYPQQTTVQESARVVHERKALPENELGDRCPRLSVHVPGQQITKNATNINISPCRQRLSLNDAAVFSLSCPAPVVDKTAKGGVRQFEMAILLCIIMDGYELWPRCMPAKKIRRIVAATRLVAGFLIVRGRVLKHGPNTASRNAS